MRTFFRNMGTSFVTVMKTMVPIWIGDTPRSRFIHKWSYICFFGWLIMVVVVSTVTGLIAHLFTGPLQIVTSIVLSFIAGLINARFWIGLYQVQTYKYDEDLLPRKKGKT